MLPCNARAHEPADKIDRAGRGQTEERLPKTRRQDRSAGKERDGRADHEEAHGAQGRAHDNGSRPLQKKEGDDRHDGPGSEEELPL